MEKQIKELIDEINKFDLHYEMSDSADVIIRYTDKENSIGMRLKMLSEEHKKQLKNNLSKNGKLVYDRYFKII